MVDREARNELIGAVERYLDGITNNVEFDEEIFDIAERSSDPTIFEVAHALWTQYDDCQIHHADLSKPQWNYFQRLVLVLRSDACIETVRNQRWTSRQVVAASGALAFIVLAVGLGFGFHLALVTAPLGFVPAWLSRRKQDDTEPPTALEVALMPFASVAELLAVRRSVPGFAKRRYRELPVHLQGRSAPWFTRPVFQKPLSALGRLHWLVVPPLGLLPHLFPETDEKTSVRLPHR